MSKANMAAREDAEQATLFSWAAMQSGKYPELALLFHIPNGGKRNAAEAARFRAEGVKAGVPDLFLPVARCDKHGLWIEMKRKQGGRVSEHQSEWIGALRAQGYAVEVCYGWEEASRVIVDYLSGEYDTSSTASGPPSPEGKATGGASPSPTGQRNAGGASPSPTGVGAHKAKKHSFNFEEWMANN